MKASRALAVAALVLALAACSREVQPAKKIVLIGLDGGTWDLLDGYIERGQLPNIAKLREHGVWAPLQSIQPSSSPVIWTSIATGKSPEKHGITFFVRFPGGDTGKPGPVTSTMPYVRCIRCGIRGFTAARWSNVDQCGVCGADLPRRRVDSRAVVPRLHPAPTASLVLPTTVRDEREVAVMTSGGVGRTDRAITRRVTTRVAQSA